MSGPAGITLNAGSGGADLGVDTDGTYDYQIIKVGFGASGATPVQVSTGNPLPVTFSGTQTVSGTVAVSSVAGTVATSIAGTVNVAVTNGIATGTAGTPSTSVLTVQGIAGMTAIGVSSAPAASGGLLINTQVSASGTPAAVQVKSTAGQVYWIDGGNTNATPVYLKFFNGSPTVGTTNCIFQVMLPGNTAGAGRTVDIPSGIGVFSSSIYVLLTGGMGLADATAIGAATAQYTIGYF
jgi:hypothetical protein